MRTSDRHATAAASGTDYRLHGWLSRTNLELKMGAQLCPLGSYVLRVQENGAPFRGLHQSALAVAESEGPLHHVHGHLGGGREQY